MTNYSTENITCHNQNVIFFFFCNECRVQYGSESTLPLHKRINLHRRAKFGCENVIKHFKDFCISASFSVQIIQVLSGIGCNNNKACPDNRGTTIIDKIFDTCEGNMLVRKKFYR